MAGTKRTVLIVACGLGLLVAVIRLVAWSGNDPVTRRDASRILACEDCGAASILDPELVRRSHQEGTVRVTGHGPRFGCPSCGAIAARAESLDFRAAAARCEQCGQTLIHDPSEAGRAVERGGVQAAAGRPLAFRCKHCEAFSGRMMPREAPGD